MGEGDRPDQRTPGGRPLPAIPNAAPTSWRAPESHARQLRPDVPTPQDPASSRLGESFYRFLPRTVSGSLRSAWELERARLQELGSSTWTARNDILTAWAMTVVLFAALAAAFGPVVLPYLLLQAVVGFSLLEVVNYLEHYGLLRQHREAGRYERT